MHKFTKSVKHNKKLEDFTCAKEIALFFSIGNKLELTELLFNSNANGWWLHFTVISDKMAFSLYRYFPLNASDLLEILKTKGKIELI